MDQEVSKTLSELEGKLRELQRELTSIGQPQAPSHKRGRLIDEAAEAVTANEEAGSPGRTWLSSESQEPREAMTPGDAPSQLLGFRSRLEHFARELIDSYDELLGRLGAGPSSTATPAADHEARAVVRSESSPDEALFTGHIELGVGPFYDIGSLSAFERSLMRLPHALEASVRRFEASHAVIDLRLTAPIALVSELRNLVDARFNVRSLADGRLLLTFEEA